MRDSVGVDAETDKAVIAELPPEEHMNESLAKEDVDEFEPMEEDMATDKRKAVDPSEGEATQTEVPVSWKPVGGNDSLRWHKKPKLESESLPQPSASSTEVQLGSVAADASLVNNTT